MEQEKSALEKDLDFDFQDFENRIFEFTRDSFSRILSQCKQRIYALTIYTSGPSWSYLFPSFNTEESLLQAGEEKDLISPLSTEEKSSMYRWVPYDWRYHLACESWGEALDPLLDSVRDFIEKLPGSTENPQLHGRLYQALERRTTEAIKRVCSLPLIQERWQQGEFLLINFIDYESGRETERERAEAIGNPRWILDIFERESEQSDNLYQTHFDALDNISAPDIHPDTLSPWVDRLEVDFKVESGFLLKAESDPPSPGIEPGEFEFRENSIELLNLLEGHPQFDKLSAYYNSLAFIRCESGDPLFEFGRELAHRLLDSLKSRFPDHHFIAVMPGQNRLLLHICIDRDSLPESVALYRDIAGSSEGMETLLLTTRDMTLQ